MYWRVIRAAPCSSSSQTTLTNDCSNTDTATESPPSHKKKRDNPCGLPLGSKCENQVLTPTFRREGCPIPRISAAWEVSLTFVRFRTVRI
jgi:hypothetical protein